MLSSHLFLCFQKKKNVVETDNTRDMYIVHAEREREREREMGKDKVDAQVQHHTMS
jgi:hypothetical protein